MPLNGGAAAVRPLPSEPAAHRSQSGVPRGSVHGTPASASHLPLALMAQCMRDRDYAPRRTSHPIAKLSLQTTADALDPLHDSGQHESTVIQQTAISRVADIRFHNGRIYKLFPSMIHGPLLRNSNDWCMQLPDSLQANGLTHPYQRLRIRHLL